MRNYRFEKKSINESYLVNFEEMNKVKSLSKPQPKDIIWKIKLDDSKQTLVWEIRNSDKKLSFGAYNFAKSSNLLQAFSFADDWHIGLDFVYDGMIYFHGYESEFSPVHKGVIAFDLYQKEIIWQNFSVSVQEYTKTGLVVFDPKIFPRNFQLLNLKTGELISSINLDAILPENRINNRIFLPKTLATESIWDTTQTLVYKDYKMISFYQTEENLVNQYLEIYKNNTLLFKDLINQDIQKLSFDTFFLWLDQLIYIKNKSEILTYLV